MPKPRKTLKIKLPTRTGSNRLSWRRLVLSEGVAAVQKANVIYTRDDILEVKATVYLTGRQFEKIDVDNLLKDLCDALQGQHFGREFGCIRERFGVANVKRKENRTHWLKQDHRTCPRLDGSLIIPTPPVRGRHETGTRHLKMREHGVKR